MLRFVLGLLIGAVAVHLLAQDRPSAMSVDLPSPVKVAVIEEKHRDERIRFDFKDGRSYTFRLQSVSGSAWFPEEWAVAEGLNHPYVELILPGRTVRLDIPDEATGREIYSLIFSGELGEAWED